MEKQNERQASRQTAFSLKDIRPLIEAANLIDDMIATNPDSTLKDYINTSNSDFLKDKLKFEKKMQEKFGYLS